jgi:hypothetical protein
MGMKLGLTYQGKNKDLGFQNRVVRRIYGPKREEMAGSLEKTA